MKAWLPTPTDGIGMPLPLAPEREPNASPEKDWHFQLQAPPRLITDRVTPTDAITGLPLPIACVGYKEFDPEDTAVVSDHHGYHPRSAPLFRTQAGKALRSSWKQAVPYELHNMGKQGYHSFLDGPVLPTDEDDIYSRVVMACAGYIPSRVIDLSSGQPIERGMTEEEWEFFRTPHPTEQFGYRYIKYSYEPIRDFFRDYVIHRRLGYRHAKKVNEFLSVNGEEDKRYLGHLLLMKATELVPKKVRVQYSLLQRAGLLDERMPNTPLTLIKNKLGTPEQREALIPSFEHQLRGQSELVEATA